jgi:23S rRNA (cytosine1962-C5)-methyltransferase
VAGVGMMVQVVGVIMDPEGIVDNALARFLYELLGVGSQQRFTVIIMLSMIAIFIIKNIFLYFQQKFMYAFVYTNQFRTSERMMKNYLRRGYEFYLNADTAVVQAHSIGMHCHRQQIAEAIEQEVPQVDKVYYKSDDTLPHKAPIQGERVGYLIGAAKADLSGDFWAKENGLDFRIDWLRGQKTGFFIDQRDNRALLEHYAAGKEVLNMFCYTGGFSVYALRGGAKLVHSVDVSQKAIDLVRSNVARNFGEKAAHEAFAEEAFEFMARNQNKYDLIILDPPAFAKHRDAVKNALRGYQRLNAKGIQAIRPGGILFTFSCSQAIDKDMFRLAVFSAAAQVGRKVRILHQLHQPADHPINIYHPEGEYLKGLVLQVE